MLQSTLFCIEIAFYGSQRNNAQPSRISISQAPSVSMAMSSGRSVLIGSSANTLSKGIAVRFTVFRLHTVCFSNTANNFIRYGQSSPIVSLLRFAGKQYRAARFSFSYMFLVVAQSVPTAPHSPSLKCWSKWSDFGSRR